MIKRLLFMGSSAHLAQRGNQAPPPLCATVYLSVTGRLFANNLLLRCGTQVIAPVDSVRTWLISSDLIKDKLYLFRIINGAHFGGNRLRHVQRRICRQ